MGFHGAAQASKKGFLPAATAFLAALLVCLSTFAVLAGAAGDHGDAGSPVLVAHEAQVSDPPAAMTDPVPHDPWQDPGVHPLQALLGAGGACDEARCPGSEAWVEWSESIPLEDLIASARSHVAQEGRPGLPTPDAFAGHEEAPEAMLRSAWRVWWLLSLPPQDLIPQQGTPTPDLVDIGPRFQSGGPGSTGEQASSPLDAFQELPIYDSKQWHPINGGPSPGMAGDRQQDARANDGNNASAAEDDALSADGLVHFGEPRHLDELWRLHAHGRPQNLLPVDDGGAHLVVTDQAVFYRDGPDAEPTWLRRLDFPVADAQVTSDGSRFVLGSMQFYNVGTPSIHVFDTATGERIHQDMAGEDAVQGWTLTDVDGDGEDDVVGVSLAGEMTAMQLDGTVIYQEDTPEPGIHVSALDLYMGMEHFNYGPVQFADATGDGTLDLFFLSVVYEAGGFVPAVTLVAGATGEVQWSVLVDPWEDVWLAIAATTGDFTGDGLADLFFQDMRFSDDFRVATKGVSGLDGRVILRDTGGAGCVEPVLECDGAPYFPAAVADVTGDGQAELIGYSQGGDDVSPGFGLDGLEVRARGPVEGAHSVVVDRHGFDLEFYVSRFAFFRSAPDLWVWEDDAGAQNVELFIPPYSFYSEDGFNTDAHLLRIKDAKIEAVGLPDDLVMVARHTGSGSVYGWSHADDRFVRLAEDGSRLDAGVLMIVSSYPLMFHEVDGDGVPDALLHAGSGFRWVSGKNGSMIQEISRPSDKTTVGLVLRDGTPWLLERANETELALWDLQRDRGGPKTQVTGLEEGFYVMDVWDYTGDGDLDVFLREFDRWDFSDGALEPRRTAGDYQLVSMGSSEVLWEQSSEDHQVSPAPLLGKASTREILVMDVSGDEPVVTAWSAKESGPLWSKTFEDDERIGALGMGLVALMKPSEDEEDEGMEVLVLRGGSGSLAHTHRIDEPQRVTPLGFVDLGRADERLVVGHTVQRENMPEAEKHVVEVVDWRLGRVQGAFEVTAPQTETQVIEGEGFSTSYSRTWITSLGPVVGDWTKDGVAELSFTEYDEEWHGVVRAVKDGEPIAVGPPKSGFTTSVDLNGDGPSEVVLAGSGVLRVLAYDPDHKGAAEDDEVTSFTGEDQDARDNRTDGFFGGDDRGSPGLPALVLLGVLVSLLLVSRRLVRGRD